MQWIVVTLGWLLQAENPEGNDALEVLPQLGDLTGDEEARQPPLVEEDDAMTPEDEGLPPMDETVQQVEDQPAEVEGPPSSTLSSEDDEDDESHARPEADDEEDDKPTRGRKRKGKAATQRKRFTSRGMYSLGADISESSRSPPRKRPTQPTPSEPRRNARICSPEIVDLCSDESD